MDQFNIPQDLECTYTYVVREEHTAKHIGSGTVEVLSTPSMIAFMEHASLECIQKYLPKGYTTVGIRVDVKHLKPAPKEAEITVKTKLVKHDGRKLVFKVQALWGNMVIGEGVHERYIVNEKKFIEKLNELTKSKGA